MVKTKIVIDFITDTEGASDCILTKIGLLLVEKECSKDVRLFEIEHEQEVLVNV